MPTPAFLSPKRRARTPSADAGQEQEQAQAQAQQLLDLRADASPNAGKLAPVRKPDTSTALHEKQAVPAKAAKTAQKMGSAQKMGRPGRAVGDGAKRAKVRAQQSLSEPAHGKTVEALRRMATRPELVDLAEALQPGAVGGAFLAMVDGATTRGPSGAADRGQLWRVLGMPWISDTGGARAAGTILGAVVGEAVARLEQHRRHAGGTVDGRAGAKVLDIQADPA
jgi:hypothetical protein